jgi:hypothetical protein
VNRQRHIASVSIRRLSSFDSTWPATGSGQALIGADRRCCVDSGTKRGKPAEAATGILRPATAGLAQVMGRVAPSSTRGEAVRSRALSPEVQQRRRQDRRPEVKLWMERPRVLDHTGESMHHVRYAPKLLPSSSEGELKALASERLTALVRRALLPATTRGVCSGTIVTRYCRATPTQLSARRAPDRIPTKDLCLNLMCACAEIRVCRAHASQEEPHTATTLQFDDLQSRVSVFCTAEKFHREVSQSSQ